MQVCYITAHPHKLSFGGLDMKYKASRCVGWLLSQFSYEDAKRRKWEKHWKYASASRDVNGVTKLDDMIGWCKT